ncbi:helix-turn-helix transcriptional regulator [Sphingobacterium siyangense]|uniref:helix-turn-helix transcriptional regulator n=1 Tax=Sphingobacterium siyangense TaxID=459529 RepID=UPI003DA5B02E
MNINKSSSNQDLTESFLRLDQILQHIPVSKSTWWSGCKTGRFPKPYKIAPRITAWKTSDIQACIASFVQTKNNS